MVFRISLLKNCQKVSYNLVFKEQWLQRTVATPGRKVATDQERAQTA